MSSKRRNFTQSDVHDLLDNPGSTRRAEIASRLGVVIETPGLTAEALRRAQDIVAILSRDIEVEVRAALANALRCSPHLPHLVALSMANDVDAVAVPILSASLVLTDDDLLEIIGRGSPAVHKAIAIRPGVNEAVSAALVTRADEAAVTALMRNVASLINDDSLTLALDRFPYSDGVKHGMAQRPSLPVTIAERLVTLVSDELQHYLLAHHNLPRALAAELALRSREQAILRISRGLPPPEKQSLADQVVARGRLTPTLLLRSLCTGDTAFFEAGLARLASIPAGNVRTLLGSAGSSAFAALYKSCGLPQNLLPAFRAMIEVTLSAREDGAQADMARYRASVIERFRAIVQSEAAADIRVALDCIREVTNPERLD